MRVFVGDITQLMNVEAIVNAANGVGRMGAGVAGAIARAGGQPLLDSVTEVVKKSGPFKTGQVYISNSGFLLKRGIQKVYHAVTMDYPGGNTPLDTIAPLLRLVFDTALKNGVESIAFGGMGCGIGGLSKSQVAKVMATVVESYHDQLKIVVVDMNPEFIEAFKQNTSIPIEEESPK